MDESSASDEAPVAPAVDNRSSTLRSEQTARTGALKHGLKESFDDAGLTDMIGAEQFYGTVRGAVEGCVLSMRAAGSPG
jgi:hypothetical protein